MTDLAKQILEGAGRKIGQMSYGKEATDFEHFDALCIACDTVMKDQGITLLGVTARYEQNPSSQNFNIMLAVMSVVQQRKYGK